jgi:hypothetical protein
VKFKKLQNTAISRSKIIGVPGSKKSDLTACTGKNALFLTNPNRDSQISE